MANQMDIGHYCRQIVKGAVIGDALGAQIEFNKAGTYKVNGFNDITMSPGCPRFGTVDEEHSGWFTDDTIMQVCQAMALRKLMQQGIDKDRLVLHLGDNGLGPVIKARTMDEYLDWMTNGTYAPSGHCDDIGLTCAQAVGNYGNGEPEDTTPGGGWSHRYHDDRANGNGSLMRMAQVTGVCLHMLEAGQDSNQRARLVREYSALTHPHPKSILCCIFYEELSVESWLHKDENLPFEDIADKALGDVRDLCRSEDWFDLLPFLSSVSSQIMGVMDGTVHPHGSGYVIDSLACALAACKTATVVSRAFRRSVLQGTSYGKDNDTIAAITGGMAAMRTPEDPDIDAMFRRVLEAVYDPGLPVNPKDALLTTLDVLG